MISADNKSGNNTSNEKRIVRYKVTDVLPGKKYYFKISSFHLNHMESQLSNSVETQLGKNPIPPTPESINIIEPKTERDEFKAQITWSLSEYDDLSYFNVYRSKGSSAITSFVRYNQVPIPKDVRVFNDFGPFEDSKKYYYKVTAVSSKGIESQQSATVAFNAYRRTRLEKIVNIRLTPKPGAIDIYFDTIDDKHTLAYVILRSTDLGGGYKLVTRITDPKDVHSNSTLLYTDKDLDGRTTYCYTIHAEDHSGIPSESLPPICEKPLNDLDLRPPYNLEVIPDSSYSVNIEWKIDPTNLLRGYLLTRKQHATNKNEKDKILEAILPPRQLRYRDTTVQPGVQYTYYLRSIAQDNIYGAPSKPLTFVMPMPKPNGIPVINAYPVTAGYFFSWEYAETVDYFNCIIINTKKDVKNKETIFKTTKKEFLWEKPPKGSYEFFVEVVYKEQASGKQGSRLIDIP